MGKKGGSAPEPDERIGEAALLAAQTGQQYLDFMRGQAAIANDWAENDRERYLDVFQPREDQFVADAFSWDSPQRKQAAASEASSDVSIASRLSRDQQERAAMSMGVNPASGAFQASAAKNGLSTALASAGAGNMARRRVEAEADAKQANAINLGKGMAVNPGTSLGLANGAASSGFNGAMQGYNQQGNLLNTQYQQQMQAYQANQSASSDLWGAIGGVIGMMPRLPIPSDKNIKTDKKPVGRSLLKAVKDMPIEEWRYKDGHGDGGKHIGTYAQDFKRATGKGDGRTINVIDAIGTTMGAVKELSDKVDKLADRDKARPKARRLSA